MKIRRGLTVTVLAGSLVVASAQPAQAVYLAVEMIFGKEVADYLALSGDLDASYTPYRVSDGFAAAQADEDPVLAGCTDDRAGKAQRKVDGKWKTVDSARSNDDARLKFKVPAKKGTYRVLVPKYMNEDTGYECYKGVSKAKAYKG